MSKRKPEETDPEKIVGELLSAPDSVRQNKVEKAKYLRRKSDEAQAKELHLAAKSKKLPSIEDIIADVKYWAADPETNPLGHATMSISGDRYDAFGRYPIEIIKRRFGNWQHVMEIAGLRDTPATKQTLAAITAKSREQHAMRYYERHLKPHVFDRDLAGPRMLVDERVVLSISDTHSTFLDAFTWQCFLAAIRDLQMGEDDFVLLNGDTLEGADISSHPKIPGWSVNIQVEFDFQREMVKQIRATGFKGHIIVVGGNHGIDRWARYMSQVAPEISCIRDLRIDKQMGLEEFNVTIAQGGTIMSPMGTEDDLPGLMLFGFYQVSHGTKLGQSPAMAELNSSGYSGQSGHTHRAQLAYGTTRRLAGMSHMSTPMGCNARAGRAYMKGTNFGWQTGFGIAFLSPGGKVHQYPIITDGGQCHVEGFIYRKLDDLLEPDPSYNWLPDLPVLEHV